MASNIFVLGLDHFNHELLRTIGGGRQYRFLSMFEHAEVVRPARMGYPSLEEMVERGRAMLAQCPGGADAVINFWDFPGCVLVPLLARRAGLPGPTLEAVARCEHKYWSRLEQQAVVPEMVPRFQAIDPGAADPASGLELDYPFWLKPVKAHSSFLGFYVDGPETFARCLEQTRRQIGAIGRPFNEFLAHVKMPAAIAAIDGHHCIAEEIISAGSQCTLEGYSWQGEVEIFGVVDSIRFRQQRSSFSRYQYPSKLPRSVQARMIEAVRRVIRRFGYDGAPFNIEFYWKPKDDRIMLLEINSRISKSHSPLFLMVDGATNQKVLVDLALGRRPEFPRRHGEHKVAAKFMLRYFHDGIMERVPSGDDLRELNRLYPEARVRLLASEGARLSELLMQDSYSYEVAEIFLGADGQPELLEKFRHACEVLNFRVRPPEKEVA